MHEAADSQSFSPCRGTAAHALITAMHVSMRLSLPVCRALSKPFVKRSATDDSKLVGNIISIVAAVGKALVPGFHYSLQVAAAEVRTMLISCPIGCTCT